MDFAGGGTSHSSAWQSGGRWNLTWPLGRLDFWVYTGDFMGIHGNSWEFRGNHGDSMRSYGELMGIQWGGYGDSMEIFW